MPSVCKVAPAHRGMLTAHARWQADVGEQCTVCLRFDRAQFDRMLRGDAVADDGAAGAANVGATADGADGSAAGQEPWRRRDAVVERTAAGALGTGAREAGEAGEEAELRLAWTSHFGAAPATEVGFASFASVALRDHSSALHETY